MGLAIKRPEKAAVGPENGFPEPLVVLEQFAQAVLTLVPPRLEPGSLAHIYLCKCAR